MVHGAADCAHHGRVVRLRSADNVNFQVADDSQTDHHERSRQGQHCRRLELRGTWWLAHGYVFRLSRQSIFASIETGQLEHENKTVEELVE